MEKIKISELLSFAPKQQRAHGAVRKYKFVLYGGAMGGGKSRWLRWELLSLLLRWGKKYDGVEVGLFCEDYPALKDRQLSKIEKEFPRWLGEFHSDHKSHGRSFILVPEYGGGIIKFRNLDDPSKYQSAEFAAIAVDELTKNPEETFEDLRNRLRWPGIIDVKFLAATNPGGIGHGWVKKRWLDKVFDEAEQEKEQFHYVPATVEDNPFIDKSYLKTLDSLPADKRRAFREGDWDIFKGQYFSEWRRNIHVCKSFPIDSEWKRFVMGDYGYLKPSAVYWGVCDPEGFVYIYRELYQTELTFSRLAEEILAMTPDDEDIRYWVFDPSIWARRGENEDALSGAEVMTQIYAQKKKKHLLLLRGNNDRINGWLELREYLKPVLRANNTIAKLQVFDTCENLIRTLPSLVYDEHKVEDCDTDGEDHAADAIRYGLMSRPQPSRTQSQIENKFFASKMKKKLISGRV